MVVRRRPGAAKTDLPKLVEIVVHAHRRGVHDGDQYAGGGYRITDGNYGEFRSSSGINATLQRLATGAVLAEAELKEHEPYLGFYQTEFAA